MPKQIYYNYVVNVKCPHCHSPLVVAISGFGGELSNRHKTCSKCSIDFMVHVLTVTSEGIGDIGDGEISGLRERISHLNKERKKTYSELLIRHNLSMKLYRECLEEAERMRQNYDQN